MNALSVNSEVKIRRAATRALYLISKAASVGASGGGHPSCLDHLCTLIQKIIYFVQFSSKCIFIKKTHPSKLIEKFVKSNRFLVLSVRLYCDILDQCAEENQLFKVVVFSLYLPRATHLGLLVVVAVVISGTTAPRSSSLASF